MLAEVRPANEISNLPAFDESKKSRPRYRAIFSILGDLVHHFCDLKSHSPLLISEGIGLDLLAIAGGLSWHRMRPVSIRPFQPATE